MDIFRGWEPLYLSCAFDSFSLLLHAKLVHAGRCTAGQKLCISMPELNCSSMNVQLKFKVPDQHWLKHIMKYLTGALVLFISVSESLGALAYDRNISTDVWLKISALANTSVQRTATTGPP